MKYAILAAFPLLSFFCADVALASFTRSCSNINLEDGFALLAICTNEAGRDGGTGINLNNYVANLNGTLSWKRPGNRLGNYIATSQNCELDFQSGITILHCDTQKSDGSWTSSSLNLDERIENRNGNLVYPRRFERGRRGLREEL